jgi:hypothetical protein
MADTRPGSRVCDQDKAYPDFQIVEFKSNTTVIGRNCGSKVSLGDAFTRIVRQDFTTLASHEFRMTETVLADGVTLEVQGIEEFDKPLDSMYPGHEARVTLAGADTEQLYALRSVLDDRSHLAIQAPDAVDVVRLASRHLTSLANELARHIPKISWIVDDLANEAFPLRLLLSLTRTDLKDFSTVEVELHCHRGESALEVWAGISREHGSRYYAELPEIRISQHGSTSEVDGAVRKAVDAALEFVTNNKTMIWACLE